MKLLIVESPAKCKTIANYLGDEYKVDSSIGHIRDLKIKGKGGFGVDIENNFQPEYYQTMTGDIIKKAKDIYRLGKRANAIYVQGKTGHERWEERSRYQREAIFLCVDLLSDIDVAKTLFNIRGKRVKYWTKQVVTVKRMYIAWHNADKERYAKYIN